MRHEVLPNNGFLLLQRLDSCTTDSRGAAFHYREHIFPITELSLQALSFPKDLEI